MADPLPIFPINEQLEIETSYEFAGNGTLIAGDGGEFRNAPHPHPLAQYNFRRELLNQRGVNKATLQVIRDFLDNLKGKAGRFRYRDPVDNVATAVPYTIHLRDDSSAIAAKENSNPPIAQTQGILFPEADGVETQFQLCKEYRIIASNATSVVTRPITRPAIGYREILTNFAPLTETLIISIFQAGIEVTNYTVDETTGVVTFTAPPTGTLTVFDDGIETTDFTVTTTIEAITFATFPTGSLTFEENGSAIALDDYVIDEENNAVFFNPPLTGTLTVLEDGSTITSYTELNSPEIDFTVIPTGEVTVFEDGQELTDFDYDAVSGMIMFGIIPVGKLTADFSFDVPCQIATDIYNVTANRYDIGTDSWLYQLEQIEIKEVRESAIAYPLPEFNEKLELDFPIDATYDSQTGRENSTLETESSSGFLISNQQYDEIIPRFELGNQENLTDREKEFVLCLWRCSLGTISSFDKFEPSLLGNDSFRRIETKFNDNRLSIDYLANNERPFRFSAIAATGKPVLLNSILNAPETTKFYFVIDTTSLVSATVIQIQNAVNQLKPLLRDNVYGGNQSLADSNVTVIRSTVSPEGDVLSGNESWMDWYNNLFESEGYYIYFMDEAAGGAAYHDGQNGPPLTNPPSDANTAPTTFWNSHFSTFKANFSSRNYFNSIVYQVEDSNTALESQAFQKHITEAFFGTNGYESIEPYNIRVRVDVLTSNLTTDNLFDDLLGLEPLGTNLEKDFFTTYTNARCILIQRKDGVNIAATNCSYPLIIDSITYQPEAGQFTDIEKSREPEGSDSSMNGILISDNGVTIEDIRLGLFEGATVEIFIINWRDTSSSKLILFSGYFSESTLRGGNQGAQEATLTFRSWDALTEQTWLIEVTERCGLDFGSSACGVDLAPLTDSTTVSAIASRSEFTINTSRADGFFTRGTVTITSGSNASLRRWAIADFTGGVITLAQQLPYDLVVGDTVEVVAGCDRLLNSPNGCSGYNNTANFARGLGGATYVPGSKVLGGA